MDYQVMFLNKDRQKIDVDVFNRKSPLFYASTSWNEKALSLLISHGANTSADGGEALIVLCKSVNSNNLKMLDLLVQNGIDVNYEFKECGIQMTPLLFELIEYCDDTKNTILMFVQTLLKAGANPNVAYRKHNTALHIVCSNGGFDLAKVLIMDVITT